MRNPVSLPLLLTVLACQLVLATTTTAHAKSELPSPSPEWSGIKNILSVMGQGALSPADQKSILDILDIKNQVEEGKSIAPTLYPATPFSPVTGKKQPPHRNPSAF